MTKIEELLEALMKDGFEKDNKESARLALRMINRLYKEDNLTEDFEDYINENEALNKLVGMTPLEIDQIRDFTAYKEALQGVDSMEKRIDGGLSKGTEIYYAALAEKTGIMKKGESLYDEEAPEPLLSEFDMEGKLTEKEEAPEIAPVFDDVNLSDYFDEAMDFAPLLDDVHYLEPERLEALEKFLGTVTEGLKPEETGQKKDLSPLGLQKNADQKFIADQMATAFFGRYFAQDDVEPFKALAAMVPVVADAKVNENIRKEIGSFFGDVMQHVNHQPEISKAIKAMVKENKSLDDIFRETEKIIEARPDHTEIMNALLQGTTFAKIGIRMFQSFQNPALRESFLGYFRTIEGIENCLPQSAAKSVFDHPEIGETYPRKDEIESFEREMEGEDELISALEADKKILAEGKDNYVHLQSSVAETVGNQGDRNGVRVSEEYIRTHYPDVQVHVDSSNIDFDKDMPGFAKFLKEETENPASINEDFKKEIRDIVKELEENGIFRPEYYHAEEGDPKQYAFGTLARARYEVNLAVTERDPEAIIEATKKYQALEKKYDELIGRLEKIFPENSNITANISVSRNGLLPSKYRSNYKGATLLSGLYHSMGFCSKTGKDINEFLDDPVNTMKNGLQERFKLNPITEILQNKELSRVEMIERIRNSGKDMSAFTNSYLEFTRSPFRAAMGYINLYDGEARAKIQAGLNVMSDSYSTATAGVLMEMNTYMASKPEMTMMNILLYKNEDLDPVKVNPQFAGGLNPVTLEVVPNVSIREYIRDHYTFDELAAKLKEVHEALPGLGLNETELKTMTGEISFAIQSCGNFSMFEADCLKEVMNTGSNVYVDAKASMDAPMITDDSVDKNLVSFAMDFNQLVSDGLGNGAEAPDESHQNLYKSLYVPKRIQVYTEEFAREMKNQGIDLEALGYKADPKDITRAIQDAAAGREGFKNAKLPAGFFQNLEQESYRTIDEKIEIPEKLFSQDPEKAKAIQETFKGVTQESTNYFKLLEEAPMNGTTQATIKKSAEEITAKRPELTDAFKITENIGQLNVYANKEYTEDAIGRYGEYQLSDQTKNAILGIYGKMKEYGMMYDFPERGEETNKMYGLHKYFDMREKVVQSIREEKLDQAYEASKSYGTVMKEYNEILDMCEKTFPQDGKHCSGNLSPSRHGYVPREFSERQQPMIQMSSIYMIASMADNYHMSFEDVINHPGEILKKISLRQKDAVLARLEDENGNRSLAKAINIHPDKLSYTELRGLESLVALEMDDTQRMKNSELNLAFYGMSADGNALRGPFEIFKDNDPHKAFEGIDYDNLKMYVATLGHPDIDPRMFLRNQIDPTTGRAFENTFDYQHFLETDTKDPAEVLNDVVKAISDGVMEYNQMSKSMRLMSDPNMDYSKIYVAAVMYMKDYAAARGLDTDMTFSATMIRNFIKNPCEVVQGYMEATIPESELNNIDYYDEGVREALQENHLVSSETLLTSKDIYTQLRNETIAGLMENFDTWTGDSELMVDERNVSHYLMLAKCASILNRKRGTLNRIFSGDSRKEKNLEDVIHKACIKAGVTEEQYDSIVNHKVDDLPGELSLIEGTIALHQKINEYTPDKVKDMLTRMFDKHTEDDLTPDQLEILHKKGPLTDEERAEKALVGKIIRGADFSERNLKEFVNLYSDLSALKKMPELDPETRKMMNESYKLIMADAKERGVYEDHLVMLRTHQVSEEQFLLDSINNANADIIKVAVDLESGEIIRQAYADEPNPELNTGFIDYTNDIDSERTESITEEVESFEGASKDAPETDKASTK